MSFLYIIGIIILCILVLYLSIRYNVLSLLLEVVFSIIGSGGGSSGSGFGGGDSGGGGSSDDW